MTTSNDHPRRRRHPLDIFGAWRARAKRRAIEDEVLDSARLRAIGL